MTKNKALACLYSYFSKEIGFIPVITPKLSKYSGIEPFIDAVAICDEKPKKEEKLYLATSPEFSLKKMLALYSPQIRGIFEISNSFRKEKKSKLHHFEFTMLEWYERGLDYLNLIHKMDDLISHVKNTLSAEKPDIVSAKVSIKELFSKNLGFKIQPGSDARVYENIAVSMGIEKISLDSLAHLNHSIERFEYYHNEWLKAQYFQLIFDNFLRPHLKQGIWHVYGFPPFLRGMSTLNEAGWSERIECFYNGIEISSGYQELSKTTELKDLWEYNNQIRRLENKTPHEIDKLLLETTTAMKGVAGIAVGIERLLMAMFGIEDIKDFFWTDI